MNWIRRLALVGLVLLTVGVIWQAVSAPPARSPRSSSGRPSAARPSPVPTAEAALARVWSAPVGASAPGCVPGPVVVRRPTPDHAAVDVVCRTELTVAGKQRVVATGWHVELVLRKDGWTAVEVAP